MMFGAGGSAGASPQESAAIVRRFAEAGGNFIDTANRYAKGESERIVGDLIRADRDRWVLATKYTLTTDPGDPNAGGTHRKSLRRAIDASLERLGTDYIDLYYVHIWDAFTPGRRSSVHSTPWCDPARSSTLQVPYSLMERTVERELLPAARALDLAVTGWGPLGHGLLAGRYGSDRERPTVGRHGRPWHVGERELAIVDAVNAVAAARGASSGQVAIAWLCAQQKRALTPDSRGANGRAAGRQPGRGRHGPRARRAGAAR